MDILELLNIEAQQSQAKPYPCPVANCKTAFSRRSDLARHLRIHTNDRPHVCDQAGCGKSFIQRSALKVHKRTHSGERPHVCEQKDCGKRFSDSSSLARHRRLHTGRKPYKCTHEGCGKSFARKTILTKHLKIAHGSTAKRAMLQWRSLKVSDFKKPNDSEPLPPLSVKLPELIASPTTPSSEMASPLTAQTNTTRHSFASMPPSPVPSLASPVDTPGHSHYQSSEPKPLWTSLNANISQKPQYMELPGIMISSHLDRLPKDVTNRHVWTPDAFTDPGYKEACNNRMLPTPSHCHYHANTPHVQPCALPSAQTALKIFFPTA